MTSRQATAHPIRPPRRLKAASHTLNFKDKTLLMAVVNLTTDSFSQDGRLVNGHDPASNVRFAKQLVTQGADILDLGAESSRPGAKTISVKEELSRLMPTLVKLSKSIRIPISVDCYKPEVAEHAMDGGASIINNIHGTQLNPSLLRMIRNYGTAIVLMHMKGTPTTMQRKTVYKNLLLDVRGELERSIQKCLDIGIKKDRIIIDPGIGFAKNAIQNLQILGNLSFFHQLGCPLLVGPSRKSFIGHVLGNSEKNRLMGTAAAVSMCIAGGAHIVRVHDVKEMKDVVLVADAIINQS